MKFLSLCLGVCMCMFLGAAGQNRMVFSKVKNTYLPVILNDLKFVSSQGDVGCGKTVVAFLACMEVIGAGYQVGPHGFIVGRW